MRSLYLVLLASLFVLLGCSSQDYVSGWAHFPPGTNMQSGRYHLGINVHGMKRYDYVDRTKKKVYLVIEEGEEEIFRREYEVIAGELEWDVTWDSVDDLQILFYQYRERATSLSRNIIESNPKEIFSVRFTYNREVRNFVEYPVIAKVENSR